MNIKSKSNEWMLNPIRSLSRRFRSTSLVCSCTISVRLQVHTSYISSNTDERFSYNNDARVLSANILQELMIWVTFSSPTPYKQPALVRIHLLIDVIPDRISILGLVFGGNQWMGFQSRVSVFLSWTNVFDDNLKLSMKRNCLFCFQFLFQ